MGAVEAVAELLNTLATWFLKPEGFKQLTREEKLRKLHDGIKVALDNKAYDAADLLFAELRRLSSES